MDNILISMKHMYKWLDENYEPDEGVYDVFLQEYNHLLDRRQEIQKYNAENIMPLWYAFYESFVKDCLSRKK